MESFDFNKSDRERRKDRIKDLNSFKKVTKSLQEIEDLYQRISLLQTFNGTILIATANNKKCILDTALLDSSIETLESIKACLGYGSLSDAYTLLRKFRDQSIMFLYFLAIVKRNAYPNENYDKHFEYLFDWYNSKIGFIDFDQMFKYLKSDPDVHKIIDKYGLQNNWETLRHKLNDYVHVKGVDNAYANYKRNYDLSSGFEKVDKNLKYLSVYFLSLLLIIDSTMVMSTDYIDHMEMGMTPPEGSQYNIAPSIQEFINQYLKSYDNDLVNFIRQSSIMEIN